MRGINCEIEIHRFKELDDIIIIIIIIYSDVISNSNSKINNNK